jgi:hypothetical protein
MLHDWRKEVDAQMPRLKTATSSTQLKKQPSVNMNLPADVNKFAPGWKVRDWGGPSMKPGLRNDWMGRKNVLLTHPLSRDVPCVLSRKLEVPTGKKTTLEFDVTNHPKGNWKLVVRINGKNVVTQSIEYTKWKAFQIDLTNHAGKTVTIELENRATGWAFEAAYWSRLEVVSE